MYYPNDFSSSTEVSIFHSPSTAQISSFNCINIPQTLSFPQENSQSSMEFSTNFCWDEEGFTLQGRSFFENKSDFCLSSDKDTTLGERTLCRTFKSSCENAIESLDMWAEEGLETNEEKINGMSYSTETRDLSVFNNSTSNQSYNYNTISQTLSETKLQETEPMTPSESNTEQQTIKQLFAISKRTERGRRKKLGSKGISARVLAGSDLKRTKITKHLLDSVVVTANALIEHLSKTHSLPPLKFGTLNKEFKEKMSLKKSEVKNKKIAEILNQKENNKFKKFVLKESLARFWRKSNVDKIEKMSTEEVREVIISLQEFISQITKHCSKFSKTLT